MIKEQVREITDKYTKIAMREWNLTNYEEVYDKVWDLLSIKKDFHMLNDIDKFDYIVDNVYKMDNRLTTEEIKTIESVINSILYSHMMDDDIEFLEINDIKVIGSRRYGVPSTESDLDIRIEYFDDIKEYEVFNMLNDLDLEYNGWKVDFFPVKVNY